MIGSRSSSRLVLMDLHAACCALLLLTSPGVCFGQALILPDNLIRAVGESIVISPLHIPNPPYYLIRWKVNTTTILVGPPNGIVIQSPYTDRASLNTSTLALELRNLLENDTGQYSLMVDIEEGAVTAQTTLHVHVPVSGVTIVLSQSELFELNSTVSLVCSASGSSLSYIWLNGSSEVTADERIQLTDNNSTMSINSVIRGDIGPYRCEASNMLGKETSPQLSLIIYYGPENVAIAADPAGPFYESGSNLKLTCSAESSPPAEFQWAVNGTHSAETGPELQLNNIQISQSGNYTCIAHNKPSLRYNISEPISITVLERENAGGESLSAGVIAGIVIGVLLGVAGIAGLIFYFMKVKEMPKANSKGNKQSGAADNTDEDDSNYENMVCFKNKNTVGGADTQMRHTPQADMGVIYENL